MREFAVDWTVQGSTTKSMDRNKKGPELIVGTMQYSK
jgi:hypothetical protein